MAQILEILSLVWQFTLSWWWAFLPFLMFRPLVTLWLYWRNEVYASKMRYIMLEIRVPASEVTRPFKAMEQVFAGLWQLYDMPNPREKWFEGKFQASFQIEVVSIEGSIHFLLRIPAEARDLMESAVYAQYPDAEIFEVEDYTTKVPQDMPNKEWEIWGTNFRTGKDDLYPIKTYSKFFEVNPDTKEEKRVDPMGVLLEGFSRLKKGEQLWVQFILVPVHAEEEGYIQRAKELINQLTKRPGVPRSRTFTQDLSAVATQLATGNPEQMTAAEERDVYPPEMRLTPGERTVLMGIEEKVSKQMFRTSIRFCYVAKRENYFGPSRALVFSYINQFSTADLNFLRPLSATITKVHTIKWWFLDKRRVYLRKRRMWRNYTKRLMPFYPHSSVEGTYIFNIEEMATMFHFPSRMVAPSAPLPRVETKKGEPPKELPTEFTELLE